jgi:hypothetical protein
MGEAILAREGKVKTNAKGGQVRKQAETKGEDRQL